MQPSVNLVEEPQTASDVAWAAIFGGALAAVAVTLILTPLGLSFGFGSASPFHASEAGKALTMASAVWLIVVQWVSSGLGGYMTGRLRAKWQGAHTHEVFFRDTAHGFLTWALATVVGAVMLLSIGTHMAGHAMEASSNDKSHMMESYYTDSLFRTEQPAASPVTDQDRMESSHLLALSAAEGGYLSTEDKDYLTQIVATHTGLPEAEAQKRVTDTIAMQHAKIESASKTLAITSMLVTLSLLIGAFIATAAGAFGGHHRDLHYTRGHLNEDIV